MEYSKYIELGFERHNTKDPVDFQRYGYRTAGWRSLPTFEHKTLT